MLQVTDTSQEVEEFLRFHGFVPCDSIACNCGSWHERYGWIERVHDIEYVLADAGYPLTNKNNNLILNALKQLVNERDYLRLLSSDLEDAIDTRATLKLYEAEG